MRLQVSPLLLLVLALLPGCSGRSSRREETARLVRDGLGRTVVLQGDPRRIVSLAPNVTESLFALGLGGRLVGVSDFCELPEGTGTIARVGGMLNPNLEVIRALRPDLLIATTSGNDPAFASQAAVLGLPLYTLHATDVNATIESLRELAGALGERPRGDALAAALRSRLEEVHRRLMGRRSPRVLFIVWGEPLVVPGGPAFLTDALERAGGNSVTRGAPAAWPALDLESAIAGAPEVILTTEPNRGMAEALPGDPAWALVPAARRRRVYVVSGAIERPGPGVVRGIEEVARLLHPRAFESDGAPRGTPESE